MDDEEEMPPEKEVNGSSATADADADDEEEDGKVDERQTETKSVRREVYRSEKVESSKRTVPEEKILSMENRYFDPSELGPPDMTSTSYNYSYESTFEPPPPPPPRDTVVEPEYEREEKENGFILVHDQQDINDERFNVERQQKQTQKVTRVTKVTTTRTVQHIPADVDGTMGGVEYHVVEPESPATPLSGHITPRSGGGITPRSAGGITPRSGRGGFTPRSGFDGDDSFFERSESQRSAEHSSRMLNIEEIDIKFIRIVDEDFEFDLLLTSPRNDTPSQPGSPQVVDIDSDRCTIVWLRPDRSGGAGVLSGYYVLYRRVGDTKWRVANAELITEPLYTVHNLQKNGRYELRVVAKNPAGFGEPSPVTIVQLRPNKHKVPNQQTTPTKTGEPSEPGRPRIIDCDGSNVTLVWEPPVSNGTGGPIAGYRVEYRVVDTHAWIIATDYLVRETRYTVTGLRPNGRYEFRVFAKNADGFSPPSQSSGEFRVKQPPSTPVTPVGRREGVPDPPSQPQITDVDSDSATLIWAPPPATLRNEQSRHLLHYVLEYREIGDPLWYLATERPITGTQFTIGNLNRNSTYEFRVFAKNANGLSEPSEVSELCQLRPKIVIVPEINVGNRTVPHQPTPPEIMELNDDCVTICWAPVRSSVPLQGYQIEFRDRTHPPHTWLPVNAILTHSCKMTVGDLLHGHQYEFRIIAKNAIGYSKPSQESQPVFIGEEAPRFPERFTPIEIIPNGNPDEHNRLPEELLPTKESPPITDTDDSPPPIRRKPPDGVTVEYRDPTLPEVLDYLTTSNPVLKLNASGYLQHLTFHHDAIKHQVRELNGIPRIIDLLRSDEVPEVQKNACGCLRNLSFGIDDNKKAILNAGGVPALATLLKKTPDSQIMEEISSALWNLSSHDDLKTPVLNHAIEPLVKQIVIPYSGWSSSGNFTDSRSYPRANFRNSTGVLRNISSLNSSARKTLREREGLIEALAHYLHMACDVGEVDTKSVENVICVLRNLSYRLQEIEDPNYDKKPDKKHERSKSAPSMSPKAAKKKTKKQKDAETNEVPNETSALLSQPARGVALMWQPDVVRDYLKLLAQSTNADTLEGSAGTIQNLSACYWQPSAEVRTTVRREKGLPILVSLLAVDSDKVVCATATALRNLALDKENKVLIGKYAMEDLVKRLPAADGSSDTSDDTVAAVLSLIYATTVDNASFTRTFLDKGGVERLVYLSGSRQYSQRVTKYSTQVLFAIWKHKELHPAYKKAGFREDDFVARASGGRGHADTLARPISTQGVEGNGPKSRVRPDWGDDYSSRSRAPSTMNVDNGGRTPTTPSARTPQNGNGQNTPHSTSSEPTYSQVQKKSNRQQLSVSAAQSPGYTNGERSSPLTPKPQAQLDSWV